MTFEQRFWLLLVSFAAVQYMLTTLGWGFLLIAVVVASVMALLQGEGK